MNSSIGCAVAVMFGEWVPIETVDIAEIDTPETILFEKERFNTLSKEGKDLVHIILNAPEEVFLVNGKIKEHVLQNYCKHKKNWSAKTVKAVKKEVGYFLKNGK